MTILKKIKNNLFLIIVVLVYLAIFIMKPTLGIDSVKGSAYYLKEMLMIMPVIFVLTALLDLWVPKEKIMQFLGKDSKAKGALLSFVIGSVSAGPIYAAFPMCVMLLHKGASIRNIIIILSSWSVIKIPMLINEFKFLGAEFMIIRWVLTIIAILIFSWITDRIVKPKDLPKDKLLTKGLSINKNACIGCGICANTYPQAFEMQGQKAVLVESDPSILDKDKIQEAVDACPVNAIEYQE